MKFFLLPCLSFFFLFAFVHAQGPMSEAGAVRLSYGAVSDRKVDGLSTEIGYDQWEVRTPIFYQASKDWTFAAGIRYQSTNFEISDSTLLDEDRLHSLDLALFLSKKQSETLDWLFLFTPTMAGDFENTGGDAFNYMTIAAAKWKTSDTFEWIFGAVYTTGIGDDLFVPALGFIWEPTENSSLVFAGPIIRYRYNFSDNLDLVLGGQFSGNRWNTESMYGGTLEERNFRFRAYRLSATMEWEILENQALFGSVGIDLGRKVEIELSDETKIMDREVKSTASFEFGYLYRF